MITNKTLTPTKLTTNNYQQLENVQQKHKLYTDYNKRSDY